MDVLDVGQDEDELLAEGLVQRQALKRLTRMVRGLVCSKGKYRVQVPEKSGNSVIKDGKTENPRQEHPSPLCRAQGNCFGWSRELFYMTF